MNAGILLMIAYWVIFTVRKHFTPKLAAAVIMPYSVINDKFVYQLSELAQQCRRALEVQKMARPTAEPVDETQCRINVDESTGEIINFPGEMEAEQ